MDKVQIYTDGSARGNPDGPGGYGVVLHYTDPQGRLHERELSGGYKRTTNNRMELMAAIRGLEAKKPHNVRFIWVKGHAGHPENERCDALATSAADGDELMTDPGLEL